MGEPTLRAIFGAYGTILSAKLLQPNAGSMRAAIVQFATPSEAKWIVDHLHGNLPQGLTGTEAIIVRYKSNPGSYGKVRSMGGQLLSGPCSRPPLSAPYKRPPLSDPTGCNRGGAAMIGHGVVTNSGGGNTNALSIKTVIEGLMASGAMPGGPGYSNDESTVFVGGLPADTKDFDLFEIFSPFGAIAPCGVKTIPNGPNRCKGIGFVTFVESSASVAAIKALDGTPMRDGRILLVCTKREYQSKGDASIVAIGQRYALPRQQVCS